ncbi:alpha/beta hydrolase [Haloechinothrix sp. YIM 98757]|uniref:Alpha/beta hydrolase n=1 Tax=Haloechinothrix aidingensis TaxID=2752311 RepID=A0A838AAX2_9PSEU|nr:alpha/beta hydrolase [Haloechinothrix aidingensis]MBA0126392.1 alpha/beta hydrolase [Haloechinothrix aidingensis]
MTTSDTLITARGVRLRSAGAGGSAVLLLHGIGGSGASFEHQLPALAPAHRALAWDAPGYGGSTDEVPSGMAGYADRIAGILDELSVDRAHLVGVSWGGVIATRVALRHPGRVRSLVLADSTRGSGGSDEAAARMRQRAEALRTLGAVEFARRRGPNLTAPGADPATVERVVTIMSGLRETGYAAAVGSMAEIDHTAELAGIAVPTLVVVGEQDRVTGIAESEELARRIPGATLRVLGGGHAANQEHPGRFNAILTGFLASVDTGAPAGGH